MKRTIFIFILAPIVFGLMMDADSSAQNRRRRRSSTRRQPSLPQTTFVRSDNLGTPEEQAKIVEECQTPGRPRPEVEVGMYSNALLCGKAISLPKPSYPEQAKAEKVSGIVHIGLVIDEKGRVVWAEAVDGHPLLQAVSVNAACRARFSPIKISGRAVKAGGSISYNFVLQ